MRRTRAEGSSRANLWWREEGTPFVTELREHAPRAALLHLAKPPENRELVVGHAHVRLSFVSAVLAGYGCTYLISLDVSLSDRLELSGGHGVEEACYNVSVAVQHSRRNITHSVKIGRSKASRAYAMNFFRSVLLIAPMGLTSADEQSYLVKYPLKLCAHNVQHLPVAQD